MDVSQAVLNDGRGRAPVEYGGSFGLKPESEGVDADAASVSAAQGEKLRHAGGGLGGGEKDGCYAAG